MSNELKPCPFCGGEATLNKYGYRYINCPDCFAMTGSIGDVDRLVDNWNTRQPVYNWKPIEELEKLDFSEYLDLVFYNEESSSQVQVGSTDFDFKIYMYVGRTYYDKEELKERFTHFDILTPPENNQSN